MTAGRSELEIHSTPAGRTGAYRAPVECAVTWTVSVKRSELDDEDVFVCCLWTEIGLAH
jgi:hypothetical protein